MTFSCINMTSTLLPAKCGDVRGGRAKSLFDYHEKKIFVQSVCLSDLLKSYI